MGEFTKSSRPFPFRLSGVDASCLSLSRRHRGQLRLKGCARTAVRNNNVGKPLQLFKNGPSEPNELLTIAIVEDDDGIRLAYADLMSSYGYGVRAFASAEEFIAANCQSEVECLILDQRLPGLSGLELQAMLKREQCGLPIIFVTSHDDDVTRAKAFENGALHFLNKPIDADELVRCVAEVPGTSRQ